MKFIPPLESNFNPLVNHLYENKDKFAVIYSPVGEKAVVYFNCEPQVLERVVKFLLWQRPVSKIEIGGFSEDVVNKLNADFSKEGKNAFDVGFFEEVYLSQLEIGVAKEIPQIPSANVEAVAASFEGSRIGIDLGASSIKIWAGENGQERFVGSLPWTPKEKAEISYHREKIASALNTAASKLSQVDYVGISTAGIVADNRLLMSSLYSNLSKEEKFEEGRTLLLDEAKKINAKKVRVVNDGDAAAFAAYLFSGKKNVLGLSFGSSLAGGFVDANGQIPNFLNELAFVPVDIAQNAPVDPWSKDKGTGVDYFSAQAVARYAKSLNLCLENLSDGKISSIVNKLMENGDEKAKEIYETIGICLGYTLPLFHYFYNMDNVLLLGGITNGKAGEYIVECANKVIKEEFANINMEIFLPNEEIRLTGQAKIAATLL